MYILSWHPVPFMYPLLINKSFLLDIHNIFSRTSAHFRVKNLSPASPVFQCSRVMILNGTRTVLHPAPLEFAFSPSWGQGPWAGPKTVVAHYFSRKLIIDWEQQQNGVMAGERMPNGGTERDSGLNKEWLRRVTQQVYWLGSKLRRSTIYLHPQWNWQIAFALAFIPFSLLSRKICPFLFSLFCWYSLYFFCLFLSPLFLSVIITPLSCSTNVGE